MDDKTLQLVLLFSNKIFALTSKIPLQPFYKEIFILDEAMIIWNNFEIFRNEVKSIYKNFKTIKNDMYFRDIVRTEPEWTRLYLSWINKVDPIGKRLCPKSTAIISSMPNVKTAMFSVLKPGATILPHNGPYRGCLRLHMGLITPNSDDCFIVSNGEKYSWKDGEVILLDDSYVHYVVNNTNEYRVILFCDIVRPMNFIGNTLNNYVLNNFGKYTHRES